MIIGAKWLIEILYLFYSDGICQPAHLQMIACLPLGNCTKLVAPEFLVRSPWRILKFGRYEYSNLSNPVITSQDEKFVRTVGWY